MLDDQAVRSAIQRKSSETSGEHAAHFYISEIKDIQAKQVGTPLSVRGKQAIASRCLFKIAYLAPQYIHILHNTHLRLTVGPVWHN